MTAEGRRFADANGHLDMDAVIDGMVAECPALAAILKTDEDVIGGLPCLQVSWIAKALVKFGQERDTGCIRPVLQIAEGVLADFGQEGRDFIGACMVEGIPDKGESVLAPFAGPLLFEAMGQWLDSSVEIASVQLLWIDNWWDGPLSGVVLHKGTEHRFEAVWDRRTDDWYSPRVFWLYEPMTKDEREAAWDRHRLFEQKVSTVYCFHPGIERGILRPAGTHHEFYDRFPPRQGPPAEHQRAVGWFREPALGEFRPDRGRSASG